MKQLLVLKPVQTNYNFLTRYTGKKDKKIVFDLFF